MMLFRPRPILVVAPQHRRTFDELGLSCEAVFVHRLIKPWRTLRDRQNCTLDAQLTDGRLIRWHVKRYAATSTPPAQREAAGHALLSSAGIPTADLVAWAVLPDGRSFAILQDLSGYRAADRLLEAGVDFDRILAPTAALAARLHRSGLHHRDLYLNHFFVRADDESVNVKLIDAARVRPLPFLLRRRWIVKDLAQFWYSTLAQPISDERRARWLTCYLEQFPVAEFEIVRRQISGKVRRIALRDAELRASQPHRNVPLPGS